MKLDPIQAAFSQLLISGTLVHEAEFTELQKTYGISVHPQVVMVVSIDRYPDLAAQKPMQWRQDVGHMLVDVLEDSVKCPYMWIWTEEGVLVLLVEVDAMSNSREAIHHPLLALARNIQILMHAQETSVSIGIGGYYEDPRDLYLSFQEAVRSMSGRFFQGNQLIFQYGQESPVNEVANVELAAERTELLALVRICDEEGVAQHIGPLLDRMANVCHHNVDVFKGEVVDLIMLMSRQVLESGIQPAGILSKNAHFVHDLYCTIRYDKFVAKVAEYSCWLTAQLVRAQVPKVSDIVRQATLYIKQHHMEGVTLDDVAKSCCLSKYHLSHLFKKEMGIGVIEYLNQVRVDKAAFYIQTTDWPFQQIAAQVGFDDANYFSRIFRKYMQCSPTDYRIATSC